MSTKLIKCPDYKCSVLIEPMTFLGESKKLECGIPLYTVMWRDNGKKNGHAAIIEECDFYITQKYIFECQEEPLSQEALDSLKEFK